MIVCECDFPNAIVPTWMEQYEVEASYCESCKSTEGPFYDLGAYSRDQRDEARIDAIGW